MRIFHTADLHLGMKFARGYRPEVQVALVEARFETLVRMVETANREQCRLFVVAGDMFDNRQVAKRDVVRAAEALRAFEGRLVIVLPGNHDFIQAGDDTLWNWFREAAGERTLLLGEARRDTEENQAHAEQPGPKLGGVFGVHGGTTLLSCFLSPSLVPAKAVVTPNPGPGRVVRVESGEG